MIEMHDGNCRPFTIDRLPGREVNAPAWDLKNGQLFRAATPLLGWRVAPFAYSERGIEGVGAFRPSEAGETPFGTGINSLPPVECWGAAKLRGPGRRLYESNIVFGPHPIPDPDCMCGYRIVHGVKETAKFFYRHRRMMRFASLTEGFRESSAIFAVQGLGLTARSVEFKNYGDPAGTIRTEHVSMEPLVLLDAEDAHAAPMFEALGVLAHVVENLPQAHEADSCGPAYIAKRARVSKRRHGLRFAENPGRDGGTFSTQSGEFGLYGAVGVLLKTQEPEPRYLVYLRANDRDDAGKWGLPGGAIFSNEEPGQAGARELAERFGIVDFSGIQVVGAVTLQSYDWTYHSIIAECTTRPRVRKNKEVAATAWMTRAEILDLAAGGKCHPLFEAALPHLLGE
jgi:8-oxo-dGTP pyrophosphatase MutT (NUDIX family)